MKVGVVGLGRLGKPVALAMDLCGHDVMGYDVDEAKMSLTHPHVEVGPDGESDITAVLRDSNLHFGSLSDLVAHSRIIFVVVQTPHAPRYEGITRLPDERRDFDYGYLIGAVEQIVSTVDELALDPDASGGHRRILAIISTCMPGTIEREIAPSLPSYIGLAHTPFFEAMGTVVSDFLNREFVLIGTGERGVADTLRRFFATITDAPVVVTNISDAEAIKVFYNCYITSKICFANTVMEACEKYGGDCDVVLDTLQMADQRLTSPRYMDAGMGDGGPCHPRDSIALSHFAQTHGLSFDLFGTLMEAREARAEWLCRLMCEHDLPKFILGTAYKAGVAHEDGSAALLCKSILEEWGHEVETWDPYVDGGDFDLGYPAVVLVGVNHLEFAHYEFPEGSVVVDPWGITGRGAVGRG